MGSKRQYHKMGANGKRECCRPDTPHRMVLRNHHCRVARCRLGKPRSLAPCGTDRPALGGIVLGFRRDQSSKWVALPLFLFWLTVMSFIWLFLLGWAQIVHGTFSPTEIAMTLIVGAASVVGLTSCFRTRTTTSVVMAVLLFLLFAGLQLLTFRLSLLPAIAHR
jgi:hypothetical protein